MKIFILGWAALYGTAQIANTKENILLSHFSKYLVSSAKGIYERYSLKEEYVKKLNDSDLFLLEPKGLGILGTLWNLGDSLNTGLTIELSRIPVKQETIEISEYLDINPYEMPAEGCALIVAEDIEAIQKTFIPRDIPITEIGLLIKGKDRVARYDQNTMYLTPPKNTGGV